MTRPPATEEPPYKPHNTDGRPNLGSYEHSGALDVVRLAHRLTMTHLDGQPPIKHELRYLATLLLHAVDAVQHNMTGTVDRMAASHNRALRALHAALDAHPVPWGADTDQRTAWHDQLVTRATMLYELARDLVTDATEHGRPTSDV